MLLNSSNKFDTLPANVIAVMGWFDISEKYIYLYDLDKCDLYEGRYTYGSYVSSDNLKLVNFSLIYSSKDGKIRKLSHTTTRFHNYDALLISNNVQSFRLSVTGLVVSGFTLHYGKWINKPVISLTTITCIADIAKIITPMYEKLVIQDTKTIKDTFAVIAPNVTTNTNTNNIKKECNI
ncbi:hypothetical protein E24_00236 [Faustovirus]|nr:hypothetical protein PRJ_Fausto_00221 [Faustovirus]AMN83164.1 hypothetical protein E24_00236 [Faustovirus]AMN84144.1 hypothetical protein D5a_00234 [Faustovirus]AMN85133.1 hypothetical protein E23_00235 [Faustovirus]QBR99129.1 hypothetical protein [Faustovirus mariensis]